MKTFSKDEWRAMPAAAKGIWTAERTDLPSWTSDRAKYLGRRTLLRDGSLLVEGLSFRVDDADKKRFRVMRMGRTIFGPAPLDSVQQHLREHPAAMLKLMYVCESSTETQLNAQMVAGWPDQ